MISTRKIARFAWDVWRAGGAGPDAFAARRQELLQELLRFTRTHSAFYAHLPSPIRDL
jgi:hypothetical protein